MPWTLYVLSFNTHFISMFNLCHFQWPLCGTWLLQSQTPFTGHSFQTGHSLITLLISTKKKNTSQWTLRIIMPQSHSELYNRSSSSSNRADCTDSLSLSHYPSLSTIALGTFSWHRLVSAHIKTLFVSFSLLLQQYPAYFVRLTWMVCEMGGK